MTSASGQDGGGFSKAVRSDLIGLVIFAVVAGLIFPLSRNLAGMQDADGVLTSLISTQKLTWYFWGQDRLANLLPALASPIHDLEYNLHFQLFLRAFASFLAPVAIIASLARDGRGILVATLIAGLVLGVTLSDVGLYNLYGQHNPFSSSLLLFSLSAGVLSSFRPWVGLPLGALAAFLAFATNLALLIFVLPFVALCSAFDQARRIYFIKLFCLQFAMAFAAYMHAKFFGEQITSFDVNPSLEAIAAGWMSFATHVRIWLLAGLFVLAAIAAFRLRNKSAMLAFIVAVGMPMAVCAMSCLTWLQMNSFDIRYYLIFVIVFVSCCSYLVAALLIRHFPLGQRGKGALGVVVLVAIFAGCLGGLSPAPGELIAERWRGAANVVSDIAIKEDAVLIAGDFWEVWPSVFIARQKLRDKGNAEPPMYGATFRGHVLREEILKLLRDRGEVATVCLKDDVEECIRATNLFVTGATPVRYVRGTAKAVSQAGHKVLVFKITAEPAPLPDYRSFCLESVISSATPHQIGMMRSATA